MAKFKPAKPKKSRRPAPQGGLGCVILLIFGLILGMLFLYWVMKSASG
jgi:high-affinity Fe2+/Pb2+ permease